MADELTIDTIPAAYADDVTLGLIDARSSTRSFSEGVDITDEQRAAILHAASRAPSAGAMMMYSIIDARSPGGSVRQPAYDRKGALGIGVCCRLR